MAPGSFSPARGEAQNFRRAFAFHLLTYPPPLQYVSPLTIHLGIRNRRTNLLTRFILVCSLSMATVSFQAQVSNAQVVTVANWAYVPANPLALPANRPTINPSGTYTVAVPKNQQNMKILLDYGTLVNGAFTPFAAGNSVGLGLTFNSTITNLNNNGTYSWAAPGDTLLVNANQLPPNTAARIRLQLEIKNAFQDQGAAVYLPLN